MNRSIEQKGYGMCEIFSCSSRFKVRSLMPIYSGVRLIFHVSNLINLFGR